MNYYKNEKPGDGSSGIGGGSSHFGGGAWKKSGMTEPAWSGSPQGQVPGWYYSTILRKNGPWLLSDGVNLLSGTTPCKEVSLLVTIHGENHSECLRLEIPGRSLEVLARDKENIYARFDFTTAGTVQIYAKWQAGHHDYEKIHSAEFKILGKSYGVKKIPLGKKILVAEVNIV